MDLEEFGEEDFDVKQWVNAQVRALFPPIVHTHPCGVLRIRPAPETQNPP